MSKQLTIFDFIEIEKKIEILITKAENAYCHDIIDEKEYYQILERFNHE